MRCIISVAFLVLSCLAHVNFAKSPGEKDPSDPIHLTVDGDSKRYQLKLTTPDEPVFHSDLKYLTITGDGKSTDGGEPASFKTWIPTESEKSAAQNVYIDAEKLATVRLRWDESKEKHVATSGVVNGNRIDGGVIVHSTEENGNKNDYIDIGRNITFDKSTGILVADEAVVVETLIVCDREFGDVFNHDRARILEYFAIYFYDVNLRYKTLPNSKISFLITGVIVIGSPYDQPFIEEARAPDGRAEFGRILSRFSSWIDTQVSSLPRFDIAVAITNAQVEWGGGMAYFMGACSGNHPGGMHFGTAVWNDAGGWYSIAVGAHEIGHLLGADHDAERNFIMYGAAGGDLEWYFSALSDQMIANFVRSDQASCLRQLDEPGSPAIGPGYTWPYRAPSMTQQCQTLLSNPSAFIEEQDTANCKSMKCQYPSEGGVRVLWLPTMENSPCLGGGRCFRGRCRKPGIMLKNVASGQCAIPQNPFAFTAPVQMAPCSELGMTPLDTFILEESPIGGWLLKTPWSSVNVTEVGDKCAYTGNAEGNWVMTDRCSTNASNQNPWHVWDAVPTGQAQIFQHRITKRCIKQEGSIVATYYNCNVNDESMLWQFYSFGV